MTFRAQVACLRQHHPTEAAQLRSILKSLPPPPDSPIRKPTKLSPLIAAGLTVQPSLQEFVRPNDLDASVLAQPQKILIVGEEEI
jgi:hypothetical protein